MALNDVIAQLVVNLSMDSASFTRGAISAERRAASMGKRFDTFGKGIGGIGRSLAGLAAPFGIAFGVGAVASIGAAAAKGLEYAGSLGEVAQQLGVTSTELQQYRYAAGQVGIDQEQLSVGLAKLTKNAGDAAGGVKTAKAPFDALGVSVTDAAGRVKSAGVLIPELADALAKIPDPARRAALEFDLFGKSGQKFDTLLAGGAKGVNALTDAASKLGLVLTPEQIAKADAASDKFAALKQVLEAKIGGFAADNADTILAISDAFGKLATKALEAAGGILKANDAQAQAPKGDGQQHLFAAAPTGPQRQIVSPADIKSLNDVLTGLDQLEAKLKIPPPKTLFDFFERNLTKTIGEVDGFIAEIDKFQTAVERAAGGAWHSFETNWNKATAATSRMIASIKSQLTSGLESAWSTVKTRTEQAAGYFRTLWDRVVGHSYMPDMVEGIRLEMLKLDGVLVDPVSGATKRAGDSFEALKSRVGGLLSELFPREAAQNQLSSEISDLEAAAKKGIVPIDQLTEALGRLLVKRGAINDEPLSIGNTDELRDKLNDGTGSIAGELKPIGQQFDDYLGKPAKKTTAEVITAFGAMATGVIGSLRDMVDSFKSGDILSGIQQMLSLVLNVVQALGQAGIIKLPKAPETRATGGPVVPGKTYLVGERGPEFITPSRSGFVHPNGSGMGGGVSVQVVPSPYFSVVVDGRARDVAAPMAAQGAVMAVAGGEQRMARRSRRNLLTA